MNCLSEGHTKRTRREHKHNTATGDPPYTTLLYIFGYKNNPTSSSKRNRTLWDMLLTCYSLRQRSLHPRGHETHVYYATPDRTTNLVVPGNFTLVQVVLATTAHGAPWPIGAARSTPRQTRPTATCHLARQALEWPRRPRPMCRS